MVHPFTASHQHSLVCLVKVYKRKTEAAKKEYLKALAAYKANQLSQVRSSRHLKENQSVGDKFSHLKKNF